MINGMAKADIRKLRKAGIEVTDEDVIALNSLASAISREAIMGEAVAAPRVAWAGGVAFHEPTQQSESWCELYAVRWFDSTLGIIGRLAAWLFRRKLPALAYAQAFAQAHARIPGFFIPLQEQTAAVRAVTEWVAALPCTDHELMSACFYSSFGESMKSEDHPDVRKSRQKLADIEAKKEKKDGTPVMTPIEGCLSRGIGISIETLRTMTDCELVNILQRFTDFRLATSGIKRRNQDDLVERIKNARFGEYIMLLDTIKSRGPKQ
jgi:hypothetical protein